MTDKIYLATIILLCVGLAYAENISESAANETAEGNITTVALNNTLNETAANETIDNQTIEPNITKIVDFNLTDLSPGRAPLGDVSLDIEIKNTGNVILENLVPVIIGIGFSSYDTMPIESLKANETGHIYVTGNFAKEGNIQLNIRIKGKTFKKTIIVESGKNETKLKEIEQQKQDALQALTIELGAVKSDYSKLSDDTKAKKEKYDVSELTLDDIKKFIIEAEAALATDEARKANASLILAKEEIVNQRSILESAKKKPFFDLFRNNLLLISTTLGAIITLFAFVELMKKKKEGVYKKIKEFKINNDTKIVVEKKVDENPQTAIQPSSEVKVTVVNAPVTIEQIPETNKQQANPAETHEGQNAQLANPAQETSKQEQENNAPKQDTDVLKSDKPLKDLLENH